MDNNIPDQTNQNVNAQTNGDAKGKMSSILGKYIFLGIGIALIIVTLLSFIPSIKDIISSTITPKKITVKIINGIPNQKTTNPAVSNVGDLDLKISIDSSNSGVIKGHLNISSKTYNMNDLTAGFTLTQQLLHQSKTDQGPTQQALIPGPTVIYTEVPVPNLEAGQKQNISFSINLPPGLPTDNYQLKAVAFDKLGHLFGVDTSPISLKGANDFLTIKDCVVMVGNKSYPSYQAPISLTETPAVGKCQIQNSTNQTLSGRIHLTYSTFSVFGYPQTKKTTNDSDKTITFPANQTIEVSVPLPQPAIPQVYDSQSFISDGQGNQISPYFNLRWTTKGPSAKIEDVSIDKNDYQKGDTIKLITHVSPSMDLYWGLQGTKLDGAILKVAVSNQNNQVCAQDQRQLPKTSVLNHNQGWQNDHEEDFSLLSNIQCSNPQAHIQIIYQGSILADYLTDQMSSSTANQTITTPSNNNLMTIQIVTATLGVIFFGIGLILLKKGVHTTPQVMALVVISLVVLGEIGSPYLVKASDCGAGNTSFPLITSDNVYEGSAGFYTDACVTSASTANVDMQWWSNASNGCGNDNGSDVNAAIAVDNLGYVLQTPLGVMNGISNGGTNSWSIPFNSRSSTITVVLTVNLHNQSCDKTGCVSTGSSNSGSVAMTLGACPSHSYCDATPPTLSWVNKPTANTCYTAATWASAQPFAVFANDPDGPSPLSYVTFQLKNSNNQVVSQQSVNSPANNSTVNSPAISSPTSDTYTLNAFGADSFNNISTTITSPSFQIKASCGPPFIQGNSGDVHSNTGINTNQ